MKQATLGLLLLILLPLSAFAERPNASNANSFIASNDQLGFDPSGAVYYPAAIYHMIQQKKMGDMMKFVLMNNTISQCVEEVLKKAPDRQDSYEDASKAFSEGLCRIQNCFMSAIIMDMMEESGGQSDHAAMAMVQATSKSNCSKSQKGNSVDPAMMQLLQKGNTRSAGVVK